MKWQRSPLRILSFDIENRPLSYLGADFTTCEVTAIAAGWADQKKVFCWLLGVHTPDVMLEGFRGLWEAADVVSGHYIRKHDLPILNGAYIELGLPVLTPKLTSDTKLDLVKRSGISASQGNLAEMLGLEEPKPGMSTPAWRAANRLTPQGIKKTRERVVGDVVQHRALRARLAELGLLGAPKMWFPG